MGSQEVLWTLQDFSEVPEDIKGVPEVFQGTQGVSTGFMGFPDFRPEGL